LSRNDVCHHAIRVGVDAGDLPLRPMRIEKFVGLRGAIADHLLRFFLRRQWLAAGENGGE
jgi:hypothetical protein